MPPSLRTLQKWMAMKMTVMNGKNRTCSTYHLNSVSVPIWPSYFVLPIGFGLLALVLFYRFASALSGKPDRLSTEPGTTHTSGQG